MSLFFEIPLSFLAENSRIEIGLVEEAAKLITELKDLDPMDAYPIIYESLVQDEFLQENWAGICDTGTYHLKNFLEESNISKVAFTSDVFEKCKEKFNLSERFNLTKSREKTIGDSFRQWDIENSSYNPLLSYQESVYQRASELLKIPNQRLVIQMPTGSGKTRTAMELVCDTLNSGSSVLWLANTEELCDQAFGSFVDTWPKKALLNSAAINLVRNSKDKLQALDERSIFYVSSIQSLWSNGGVSSVITQEKLFKDVGLVVFDEAHMAIASTYKQIIIQIIANSNRQPKFIGLTATPGRSLTNSLSRFNEEVVDENRALSDFFNNNKVSLEAPEGFETPLDYLRSLGVIASLELHRIEGVTIEDRSYASISKNLTNIISKSTTRNFNIVSSLLVQLKQGKRVLLFANSIEHSKFIVSVVQALGFQAVHLDSHVSNREGIITQFKESKIQLLCNYGILSTGFDDPKLEVIFVTRVTKSIVLYSQMIGRVLRGEKIKGTASAKVFTIDDNIKGLPKNEEIYEYFDTYFIR